MSSSKAPAPLTYTKDDMDALVDHIGILRGFGVMSIVTCKGLDTIRFDHDRVAAVANALGIKPAQVAWAAPSTYDVRYSYCGVDFAGFLGSNELPSIGYTLVDGMPVPIQSAAPAV